MPCPVSRYHGPFAFSRSMPETFHRSSSAMCVPLLSPRDTNGACAVWIFFSASTMSLPPATFAGSLFGPISTKSLYITGNRLTPSPSARNFSSAAFAWTKTTSASPRRARSSAWPVPSATTRTLMPVSFSKMGRRKPNRPDCSVDVVEATVMKRSCACAAGDGEREQQTQERCDVRLPWQFSFQETGGLGRGRMLEELVRRRALHQPALMQKQDLVGECGAPARGCA